MLRKVGIHLGFIVSIVACVFLANWQWERAHVWREVTNTDFASLSPLRNYLPVTSIGQHTTVEGLIVQPTTPYCNRAVDLAQPTGDGCVQVGVLVLGDGSAIAVALGWTASATPWMPGHSFSGVVSGTLQPSEDGPYAAADYSTPITTNSVLKVWGDVLHDGYLVADEAPHGMEQLKPALAKAKVASLHWRNLVYVANWLLFAIIIFAMWVRVSRDLRRAAD